MRRAMPAAGPVVLFLCLALFVVCAPLLAPRDPTAQRPSERLKPPGRNHILGTDGFGRDQLSRIIIGTRYSLIASGLAILVAGSLGVLLGGLSAFLGGAADIVLQRLVDVFLGVPFLVFCIVFVVILTPSVLSVGLALAFVLTPQVVRMTRGVVLPLLHRPYIEAARLAGASTGSVLLRHLLPNAAPPIIAHLTSLFGTAVTAEASLSFLGLGIPPPYPSLGRMLREGAGLFLEAAPWLSVFPGLALTVIVGTVTLAGDRLSRSRP